MGNSFKTRIIAGEGQKWTLIYTICTLRLADRLLYREVHFRAEKTEQAKQIILRILQQVARGVKGRGKYFIVHAWSEIAREGKKGLGGTEEIRVRKGYNNRRLLHIKNPDVALYQL